jgi:hypothetical protein
MAVEQLNASISRGQLRLHIPTKRRLITKGHRLRAVQSAPVTRNLAPPAILRLFIGVSGREFNFTAELFKFGSDPAVASDC